MINVLDDDVLLLMYTFLDNMSACAMRSLATQFWRVYRFRSLSCKHGSEVLSKLYRLEGRLHRLTISGAAAWNKLPIAISLHCLDNLRALDVHIDCLLAEDISTQTVCFPKALEHLCVRDIRSFQGNQFAPVLHGARYVRELDLSIVPIVGNALVFEAISSFVNLEILRLALNQSKHMQPDDHHHLCTMLSGTHLRKTLRVLSLWSFVEEDSDRPRVLTQEFFRQLDAVCGLSNLVRLQHIFTPLTMDPRALHLSLDIEEQRAFITRKITQALRTLTMIRRLDVDYTYWIERAF